MTDIPRLIEELEAATEGSIGLDVQVLHACGFGNSDQYPTWKGKWLQPTQFVVETALLFQRMGPHLAPTFPDFDPRAHERWALQASIVLLKHLHHRAEEAV